MGGWLEGRAESCEEPEESTRQARPREDSKQEGLGVVAWEEAVSNPKEPRRG